jgi:hypothetical protein
MPTQLGDRESVAEVTLQTTNCAAAISRRLAPSQKERTVLTNPWLQTGLNAWSLGIDASAVIGLRLLKIGGGGPEAEAEARLMFNEKIESGFALQSLAWTGRLGHTAHGATRKVLAHYRIKVRANKRRLARG